MQVQCLLTRIVVLKPWKINIQSLLQKNIGSFKKKLSDLTDEEIQKELYRAVGDNDVNKARLLLSQIKNVHVTKKYDPLFKAINDENERMVMLLVSNSKTDVNTIGGAGQTPLNYALFREEKIKLM